LNVEKAPAQLTGDDVDGADMSRFEAVHASDVTQTSSANPGHQPYAVPLPRRARRSQSMLQAPLIIWFVCLVIFLFYLRIRSFSQLINLFN